MSANFSGKWIITAGYAEVTRDEGHFIAFLRHSADIPPYARVDAKRDDAGLFEADVISTNDETPTFSLQGGMSTHVSAEGVAKSLLLTDGVTVLGLACGPRVNENNLA